MGRREGQEARLITSLREGEIDLFLGHAEIDPVNFTFGELFEERILLLMPRDFLPEQKESEGRAPEQPHLMDPGVLEGRRMIVPGSAMGLNLNVQLLWKRFQISPPALIQTNNTISGVQMVAAGLGYMLGNEELVRFLQPEQRENVVYCVLPDMEQTRKYFYGYAEANPEKALIRQAVAILKDMVGPD